MTVKELYDFITHEMSPEEALMRLLEGSVIKYENLKFPEGETPVHPTIIIAMAAMDMGWQFAVEKRDEIRGLTVGTQAYMDVMFKKEENDKEDNPRTDQ